MEREIIRLNRLALLSAFLFMSACGGSAGDGLPGDARHSEKLTFYAFPDELSERTLPEFERRSGLRVTLDPVPDNPTLQTKILVGHSGYDVVMPTSNFLQPLIAAVALQKLDRSKLH